MLSNDDIAWAQGRLRDCRNVKRQLRICAECLRVPDEVLLAALGCSSPDDLTQHCPAAGGPKKKTTSRWIQGESDDPIVREGVLRYAGGESFADVARLLGYKKMPSIHALRNRIHYWKAAHPEYAHRMPKRPRENEIQGRVFIMNVNKNGLPAYSFAVSPYTHNIVRVVRGETSFFGIRSSVGTDELNAEIGVTPAQAAAMYNGVICGWDTPMADPNNYNAAGVYVGPEMERDHGENGKN